MSNKFNSAGLKTSTATFDFDNFVHLFKRFCLNINYLSEEQKNYSRTSTLINCEYIRFCDCKIFLFSPQRLVYLVVDTFFIQFNVPFKIIQLI